MGIETRHEPRYSQERRFSRGLARVGAFTEMGSLREAAVLTAPDETYARERMARRRAPERAHPRDSAEDFADVEDDGGYNVGRRRTGLRLTFRGGMPRSIWGRAWAAVALLAIVGAGWAAAQIARRMVLRDERFVLASSSSVVTEGNHHLSRAQLLEVFGGDIERNILRVSLEERRAELEQIPWVKRATVMRLLPDRISVAVEERTPVAFVRRGGHIGLVDASGVLLDMGSGRVEDAGYSFPVVTGISPADPSSVRSARMKIFLDFTRDLDASGENISAKLSEVDLSNPEDVKALIPDHGTAVLVHFGDSDYLDRYRKYEEHLGEWRAQYPKLSSVDMRYERQVVLEMQAGTAVPLAGPAASPTEQTGLPVKPVAAGRTGPALKPRVSSQSSHLRRAPHLFPKATPSARVHSHVAMKAGHP